MLSFFSLLVFKFIRLFKNPLAYLQQIRSAIRKIDKILPLPPYVSITSEEIKGIPCEWVKSKKNILSKSVLMWVHGGAFVIGLNSLYRRMAAKIAEASGVAVLLIDYRLAPEYPFPAALEDVIAVYESLLEQGENIWLGGDSAGGNLAAAAMLAFKEEDLSLPKGGIILSGWLDLTLSGESLNERAKRDPIINALHMPEVINAYLGENVPANHHLVSPIYADLQGLPPLLMLIGTEEILWDDTQRFSLKAKDAGVKVRMEIGEKMAHVYPLLFPNSAESKRAINLIVEFITPIEQAI